MKGRIVVLDRWNGRPAAALVADGWLLDLLVDPPSDAGTGPGAIHRAIADRPVKGQNGFILKLGNGQTGFLRQGRGIAPGDRLLVQVATWAEAGKAAPVTTRLLFKGRFAIITPGAKGRNIARSIKDEATRDRLAELAHEALLNAPEDFGAIIRSAATEVDDGLIAAELHDLRQLAEQVLADAAGEAELLVDGPDAHHLAWRDWTDPVPDQVFDRDGSFAEHGVLEMIDALQTPFVPLTGEASMFIEATRALVAVDVNTGGDFSFAAGLKANLAAARDLPRQLRLRGLGGQVVIDFAPVGKKDRLSIEQVLTRALRADAIDTNIVGWTPLGHLELQRKRERLPLAVALA
ncbi:MAG: ribonuclease E/G [Rhodobacteraceae bacterium]|nr:ribonuclease E/G [Paracoccaceae bacterium]